MKWVSKAMQLSEIFPHKSKIICYTIRKIIRRRVQNENHYGRKDKGYAR